MVKNCCGVAGYRVWRAKPLVMFTDLGPGAYARLDPVNAHATIGGVDIHLQMTRPSHRDRLTGSNPCPCSINVNIGSITDMKPILEQYQNILKNGAH